MAYAGEEGSSTFVPGLRNKVAISVTGDITDEGICLRRQVVLLKGGVYGELFTHTLAHGGVIRA